MIRKKKSEAKVFIGADKSSLMFPKYEGKKIKGPKNPKVTLKENVIQRKVERYLKSYGLKFLHIPDALLMFLMKNPLVPMHIRKFVKEYFSGLPDLLIFHKNSEGHNFCLLLELKTEAGVVSTVQGRWHAGLNVHVTYSLKEAKEVIDEFIEFVDNKS